MAIGANDSSHSSSENDEYLDFEYLDMHTVECLNVGSPLDPTFFSTQPTPTPLAKVQIFLSKYDKPIPVVPFVELLDTSY